MSKQTRFVTQPPFPLDLRLRHIIFAPFIVYFTLNVVTVLMVMAGSQMSADPLWHWPAIQFFSILHQFGS